MDDPNMEGVTTPTGDTVAKQDTSQGTTTPSAVDAAKVAEALKPFISQELERIAQSGKDKRMAKVLDKVDNFQSQLEQLKALQAEGWSESQALRLMELEAAKQPQPTGTPPQPTTGTPKPEATINDQSLLDVFGLAPNDAQVLNITRNFADPLERVSEYAKLAKERKEREKPNPAAVTQTVPGTSPSSIDVEAIQKKLSTLDPVFDKAEYQKNMELLRKAATG